MGAPSREGMRQTHTASPGLHLPDKPGTQHGDRSFPSKRIHFLTTKVNTGELSIFKDPVPNGHLIELFSTIFILWKHLLVIYHFRKIKLDTNK